MAIKKAKKRHLPNNSEKSSWEKVKIKGRVISDDGGGYEGLIGLEVLEKYDPKLVQSGKTNKAVRKETEKSKKVESRKPNENKMEKTKVVKTSKLIEGTLENPERQKENSEFKKTKPSKKGNSVKSDHKEVESEHLPGRFVLIRSSKGTKNSKLHEEMDVDQLDSDMETSVSFDGYESWNGLGVPNIILRALVEKGFKSPTEIQSLTLPAAIMGKKDIVGAAETGSGKTLAFGIPILTGIIELKSKNCTTGIRKAPKESTAITNDNQIYEPSSEELSQYPEMDTDDEDEKTNNNNLIEKPLYAVVLTPTRELAVQVTEHIAEAAKYTGIQVAAIFGGLSIDKQERILKKCPEIVVATPGRFWELINQENPHLSKIDDISFLVIDETDRMVEKDHFEELQLLLKQLNSNDGRRKTRQNFVFSATLTLVHDLPEHMQKRNVGGKQRFIKRTPGLKVQGIIDELGISQAKIVDITNASQTAENLTECRVICSTDQKDIYLYYFLLRHPGRTIVFCNSIDCVKRLSTLFRILNCSPLPLHANMIQKQRLKNLERFRDNPEGLLIATDVAARGLDIPKVQHVIHYQVPRTSENYIHRSGRTARACQNGITVIFMDPSEVKTYVKLCKTLGRTEDIPLFPISDKYLTAVKERVNLARELDKQELKIRRSQTQIGWMKKNAEEMDMIIDGYDNESASDVDEDPFIIERRRDKVHLQKVRFTLKSLLSKEIFPKGFSYKYPTNTGKLEIPNMALPAGDDRNSAIEVMKEALEEIQKAKKLRNKKKK